ncbi:MAG TPA: hypothetical protein VGO31_13395 [Microbacteriaceae bacterium]|nr:hypothetical protein [Microbacteriaceae bacterium]
MPRPHRAQLTRKPLFFGQLALEVPRAAIAACWPALTGPQLLLAIGCPPTAAWTLTILYPRLALAITRLRVTTPGLPIAISGLRGPRTLTIPRPGLALTIGRPRGPRTLTIPRPGLPLTIGRLPIP